MFSLGGQTVRNAAASTKRYISSVTWSPKLRNPYGNKPEVKKAIEEAVVAFAAESGLDARGAEKAIVKSTDHVSGTDPNAHVTVDFLRADDSHLTTRHVRLKL